jgi:hypothetical protein
VVLMSMCRQLTDLSLLYLKTAPCLRQGWRRQGWFSGDAARGEGRHSVPLERLDPVRVTRNLPLALVTGTGQFEQIAA